MSTHSTAQSSVAETAAAGFVLIKERCPSRCVHGKELNLDFTVIGPAVNEVSRIRAMSRSVERDVLLWVCLLGALDATTRARVVSVGRYGLRGVAQPQELFTPEPGFVLL